MGKVRDSLGHAWQNWSTKTKTLLLVMVCGVVGLVVWFWPSRVDQVVRFDGAGEWEQATAPPRRLIVWQPAETLPLPASPQPSQSISPTLTDGGATLYFSRREKGGSAEIVRTRFQEGQWTTPQPVTELNSPADDMGPILSRDGKELYLFSNRPGGQGGYDLYVSTREKNKWSRPKNLGPQINTPANEYDPCLDPLGDVLYFSSNRTKQMVQRRSQEESGTDKEWAGTLRAETGERTYDLYRIGRNRQNGNWSQAESLTALNRPESHEGAPYISPDGAFLYFASDRPWRAEEDKNLDVYRVRLVEGVIAGQVENLGPGINTPAHETEPSLSPEGFRLVFSSNRDGLDQLYVSTATEVYEQTTRDTSRLHALGNPWVWAAVVCIALLIAALSLVVSHRQRLAEKVWPARFLAASLLINGIFVLLLFLWKLPGIVDAIVKQFEEPTPSSRVVDAEQLESQRTRENLYNKVADLPPVESSPTEWPNESQPTPTANPSPQPTFLPEDNSLPLAENLPAHVPKTVVAVRPQPKATPSKPKQLTRSQPRAASVLTMEEALPELAKAESQPLEALPASPSSTPEKIPVELATPTVPQVPVTPTPVASSAPQMTLTPLANSPSPRFASDVPTKQPTRQSPHEPELKQI
ncbi:MAG: PD40 domain-containing protein, partial [Planctomycetaceae bacterium]|nr:PD40 domain-containing protein [Planctomycetaceae bacterium]